MPPGDGKGFFFSLEGVPGVEKSVAYFWVADGNWAWLFEPLYSGPPYQASG